MKAVVSGKNADSLSCQELDELNLIQILCLYTQVWSWSQEMIILAYHKD